MEKQKWRYGFSIPYNLLLIATGSLFVGIGINGIVLPHNFISGGLSGVCLLIYYWAGKPTPGILYFFFNIPIFLLGWRFIGRRFFFYSLYGMVAFTLAIDWVKVQIPVQDPMLAALAGGALIGTGSGIILHSLGSAGGNDIIGIILNQKYNLRIGTFFFTFNITLFTFSLGRLPIDQVLYSLAMSFITSQVMDYVLTISNQRKLALIVSDRSTEIADQVMSHMGRGVTLLDGKGAYTRHQKEVIMTVVNNIQIKRLEELVYSIDPKAFVVMGNTYNVLGEGFSHRKTY